MPRRPRSPPRPPGALATRRTSSGSSLSSLSDESDGTDRRAGRRVYRPGWASVTPRGLRRHSVDRSGGSRHTGAESGERYELQNIQRPAPPRFSGDTLVSEHVTTPLRVYRRPDRRPDRRPSVSSDEVPDGSDFSGSSQRTAWDPTPPVHVWPQNRTQRKWWPPSKVSSLFSGPSRSPMPISCLCAACLLLHVGSDPGRYFPTPLRRSCSWMNTHGGCLDLLCLCVTAGRGWRAHCFGKRGRLAACPFATVRTRRARRSQADHDETPEMGPHSTAPSGCSSVPTSRMAIRVIRSVILS